MTRRFFTTGLITVPLLRAETPADKGRKLVDQTIYALGGDAFRNMKTRVESGRAYSFYREQLTGLALAKISTKYLDGPPSSKRLMQLQRQTFGKKGEDNVIYTGEDAMEVTFRGVKPMPEDRVRQTRESTLHDIFYIFRERLKEPGISVEASAPDVVENQPVDTLDFYDAENRRVTVWIHSSTHLPVKQRFYRIDDITRQRREEVSRFSKYRDVGDGVMWPYDVQRERDTEKIFEMYSDHVRVNEPLEDSLFQAPNGMKVLKRDKPFVP